MCEQPQIIDTTLKKETGGSHGLRSYGSCLRHSGKVKDGLWWKMRLSTLPPTSAYIKILQGFYGITSLSWSPFPKVFLSAC